MVAVKSLAHLSLFLAAAACGGGPLDPGVGNDPGGGSRTLYVNADIEASPVVTNASDAANFETELRVRLEKDGVPLTTGTVTVISNGGTTTLSYDAIETRWQGVQAGYHEVYELNVHSGDDSVDDVHVDGPDLHAFTSPLPGATVDGTQALAVTWSSGETADAATLDTDQLDSVAIADTGSYSIPVGGLKTAPDQAEPERLRLDRSMRVTPAGAIAGSEMRVRVRNEIDLVVAATGL